MTAAKIDLEAIDRRADSLVVSHRLLLEGLVAMRTKHKLTQADVAERMGVSQPTVAAFERYDANPTLATIRRYALAVEARLDHTVVDDRVDPPPRRFEVVGNASFAPHFAHTHRMAIPSAGSCAVANEGVVPEDV